MDELEELLTEELELEVDWLLEEEDCDDELELEL